MTQNSDTLTDTMRRHSLRLGAFAVGTALLLAVVYALTKDRIADQRLATERAALAEVFPLALHDNDLLDAAFILQPDTAGFMQTHLLGLSTARTAYAASLTGVGSGVILPLETADGYSGTIVLMIGINAEGAITGVRVVQHAETPGLGDKIDTAHHLEKCRTLRDLVRSHMQRTIAPADSLPLPLTASNKTTRA